MASRPALSLIAAATLLAGGIAAAQRPLVQPGLLQPAPSLRQPSNIELMIRLNELSDRLAQLNDRLASMDNHVASLSGGIGELRERERARYLVVGNAARASCMLIAQLYGDAHHAFLQNPAVGTIDFCSGAITAGYYTPITE